MVWKLQGNSMGGEISTPYIFNDKILQDAVCSRSVRQPYDTCTINPNSSVGISVEATAICTLTAYQWAQKCCIFLIIMSEEVWVGCQPQPWGNDIILTPQVHNLSKTSGVGITVWCFWHMPIDSISMCLNTLYMINVEVGSSLRWLSASTLTKWHHYDSTSDPVRTPKFEPCSVGITVWGYYHFPIDSISMCSNTLYMSNTNMDMGSSVWGSCQPQPWHYHIMLTPQVTQNSTIWAK
jgi:hypothetical protein